MPFRQKGGSRKDGTAKSTNTRSKDFWYIHVPTAHGFKSLSTRSTDRKTAQRMERMVDDLQRGGRRDPELLAWLADRTLPKEQRLDPRVLLDAYDHNRLDALKAEREARLTPPTEAPAEDVNTHVERWYKGVQSSNTKDHADRYLRAVRTFIPADQVVSPSRFTHDALLDWSNSLMTSDDEGGLGLAANTARRYRVGLLDFIDHLVKAELLASNPLASIKPPKKVAARDRHLSTPDAIRLVEAFDDPENEALGALIARYGIRVDELQGFIALLNGAGVEVSVALGLPTHHVRPRSKEVFAPGTKTYNRKRVVRVADWAWPWVEALLPGTSKHARLFASIPDRWVAADAFNAVISKLAADEPETFGNYWMRDGRHTYAVRAIKAGTPPRVVATQLGHKDAIMVHTVYGVYEPGGSERDYWEKRAAARDREEEGVRVPTPARAKRLRASQSAAERPSRTEARRNAGHTPRIVWPSAKELLQMLKTRSVVALAKELGVSDQAVRKHLKAYGVKRVPDGRRAGVASVRQRPRQATR